MQAREPELGVVSKPDANVPLDADGVFALRERIHLQREIREQVREGEAAEDAGPDEAPEGEVPGALADGFDIE